MYKVFLDMDNTLCDWSGRATKLIGLSIEEINKDQSHITKMYEDHPNMFAELEFLPSILPVLNHLKELEEKGLAEVHILTSMGLYPSKSMCTFTKRSWLVNNIDRELGVNWSRNLHVIEGHNKGSYVDGPSLLIDDYHKPCNDFLDSGGVSCHIPIDKRDMSWNIYLHGLCTLVEGYYDNPIKARFHILNDVFDVDLGNHCVIEYTNESGNKAYSKDLLAFDHEAKLAVDSDLNLYICQ